MFGKIILNYIIGYVSIKVEGYYIERFINICMSKKIFFWNMKREKSSILYANIGIEEFKKIKKIAQKVNCRVHIERKKGLPFVFNKYKKRKVFLLLLITVIIALLVCSNFVWNIEITGIEKIKYEEIYKQLEDNGLKIGSIKNKIDTKKIIGDIRLKRNDIAWIGINIDGTNVKVEIVEAKEKPEIIDENDYCNIISNKDCIISKINVQNGTAIAKVGDIVKQGEILVEGTINGKYMDTIYVNSSAEIEGKVWYSKKKQEEYIQNIEEKTGNEENKYKIKFNNFQINLYKTLSNFENYDTIINERKLSIFSNFYLPIEIIKISNYEKIEREIKYEEEELKRKMIESLEEELKQEVGEDKNILNKYVNYKKLESGIEIELVYEVLEDIGTKEKINM